ncbi:MFS transporter [Actinomadura madurae]|uniref:MFS transporter n=1 Tax=Actinomadura madurae TaxID=1993 RepID=UPI0020D2439C|nr:MFS transporter [Actinomadura madurae]MCQ0021516.1 MFS transporter [Actinomadura madurae]
MLILRRPSSGPWLVALTLTAFTLQTDDFVIVGVLPSIATGLSVSEAAAGQLVTVFPSSAPCSLPCAAVVTASWSRRRLLTGGMLVFSAANPAVPLATSYPALMTLRVVAALAAAVVLPTVFAVTAALSPPGRQGRDLATVMAGLTGAIVVGVPLGTWIGAAFGWQATFVTGGLLGLAVAFLHITVPDVVSPPQTGLSERLPPAGTSGRAARAVRRRRGRGRQPDDPDVSRALLDGLAGVTSSELGGLLVLTGVAGIVGGRFSGTLVDRFGPARTSAPAAVVFTVSMAGLALVWSLRPAHLALVVPLLLVWSSGGLVGSAAGPDTRPGVRRARERPAGPGASAAAPSTSARNARRGPRRMAARHLRLRTLPVASGACTLLALALFAFAERTAPVPAPADEPAEHADSRSTWLTPPDRWPRRCKMWAGTGATMIPTIVERTTLPGRRLHNRCAVARGRPPPRR